MVELVIDQNLHKHTCDYDFDDIIKKKRKIEPNLDLDDSRILHKYMCLSVWVEQEYQDAKKNHADLLKYLELMWTNIGLTLDHELSISNALELTDLDPNVRRVFYDVGLGIYESEVNRETIKSYRKKIQEKYKLYLAHNQAFNIMAYEHNVLAIKNCKIKKNAIDKSVEIYDTYLDMLKDVTHSIKDERERARRERIIDEVFDKPLLVGSLNRKCVAHAKEIAPIYFNSSKEHTYKFTEGYILGNL